MGKKEKKGGCLENFIIVGDIVTIIQRIYIFIIINALLL